MSLAGRPGGEMSGGGNLWATIWQMSWPMLCIMVFNFFVGLADVYVAGLISPETQAAVGFVSQIYFFIIILANAIGIGTLALVARETGAGDTAKALQTARQSLFFSLLIGSALTGLTLAFHREIIALAGFPGPVREIAEKFLRIFALSLGPNYVLIISNAVFRATGEVRKPLLTMFIVSLINIAGDFMLVFGSYPVPAMGYQGIAVATSLSVFIGLCVNLLFLTQGRWRRVFSDRGPLSPELIGKIVRIAWPAAVLQVAWGAGTIMLYNILGRLGDESIVAMASLTNGLRIEAVIYLPAFALNMAASVLVGQNLGSGDPVRAAAAGWRITGAGMLVISLMSVTVYIFAELFASGLTGNPEVIRETARYLRFNMLAEPFMAMSAVLGGGLQGAGDTKGTMWVIIVSMWLIRLPLAYALALSFGYGALGVWFAMVLSMTIQGCLMALRFYRGGWRSLAVD
ncbi:MAG: MATE family efflux transporter [Nitrospirae bacterium]|nr:MAG: MATE family efflux transporter [Nitrospirota bacterium]